MATTVDHLLFVSPDLQAGTDEVERLLGVRPAYGGRHVGLGTHNALLALGARTYLEVIAPDPSQKGTGADLPYGMGSLEAPSLRAWAAAPDDIDRAVRDARAAGLDFDDVVAHGRQAPDGTEVRWRMATRPSPEPGVAAVPFLIDWGEGTHPAERAPGGVRLVELEVSAPDPDAVERALVAIGIVPGTVVSVGHAPTAHLEALLVGPSGRQAVLRS